MTSHTPAPPQVEPPTEDFEVVSERAATGTYRFTGQQLAAVSSRWQTHGHDQEVAPRGVRCSACRWTEVEIYRSDPRLRLTVQGTYLVVTRGCSAVSGEQEYTKTTWTDSPYEVLEILTQRKAGQVFLPGPAARALARAAEFDEGINDAYVNRAVS